ncbi:hypothetical protein I79_018483 [Cricetulus griseus]|uniref:Uncharacterized protein n=1 Tax=Cricetulus griseus TaxID=10029 RepID=G3I4U5_CRIGR|nr:hypothetical protein I79_018483 [Cricetulus griseus]
MLKSKNESRLRHLLTWEIKVEGSLARKSASRVQEYTHRCTSTRAHTHRAGWKVRLHTKPVKKEDFTAE